MSAISITGLVKLFGNVVALDNVDLQVEDGEFLTILGPSGSGKTTMLLAIAGFERPTAGTISFNGVEVTNVPAHKRKVGLTFQSYALFPHMTVEGNVGFPLRVRGIRNEERTERIERTLDLVRLKNLQQRKPHELSGGQQQRVALARALVFEPDILLLDEPLAALDRQLRQTVQVELRELQRSLSVTTVAVTHDQEEALTMSDRILVLDRGTVQQLGPPGEVYRQPCNRFVASFLGAANLFEGVVRHDSGSHHLDCAAIGLQLPIGVATPDTSAVAMLRPEQIQVVAVDSGQINGRVRTAVYLGASTRYRIEIAGDSVIEVTEAGPQRFSPGELVGLRISPSDVWLLPDSGGGSSGVGDLPEGKEMSWSTTEQHPIKNGVAQ